MMGKEGAVKGGTRTSEVDSDRLWRDRINQELSYQRMWVEEYGFMVGEEKQATLRKGIAASSVDATEQPKTALPVMERYGSHLASTSRATFKVRPSPELRDVKQFNRKKDKQLML